VRNHCSDVIVSPALDWSIDDQADSVPSRANRRGHDPRPSERLFDPGCGIADPPICEFFPKKGELQAEAEDHAKSLPAAAPLALERTRRTRVPLVTYRPSGPFGLPLCFDHD